MDEPNLPGNLREVYRAYVDVYGLDGLRTDYPGLAALAHASRAVPAIEAFGAMQAKIRAKRDEADFYFLNAVKLDLHGVQVAPENRFRGDGGDSDVRLCSVISDYFQKDFVSANYLCHLSTTHRYMYVSVPKSGCTKIKKLLHEAELGLVVEPAGQVHWSEFSPLLEPIDDIDTFISATTQPDWFRFGFVRNPFTRLFSCYQDKIVRSEMERRRLLPILGLPADAPAPSFKAFIRLVADQDDARRDIHWASQCYLLRPDIVDYTFVGRFEAFADDLGHVCERLAITPLEPLEKREHRGTSSENIAQAYGAAERDMVAEIYRNDFETFGYDPQRLPD